MAKAVKQDNDFEAAIDLAAKTIEQWYGHDKERVPGDNEPTAIRLARALLARHAVDGETAALRARVKELETLCESVIKRLNCCGDFAGTGPVVQSPELQAFIFESWTQLKGAVTQ